jgi:phospholipid transport system substrate-binding protein
MLHVIKGENMGALLRKGLAIWGISLIFFASSLFAQGGPTAQVKASITKVVDILKDPALKKAEKEEERRKQLRDVILPRFDFREMAQRSLGLHWRDRTPQERDEFVSLFTDLLEGFYRKRIESYTDEEILYTGEQLEDKFAVVNTKIVSRKEQLDVPVEYKVILRDGQWKVYDVVIEGVSLVSNYRSQFNRIIRTSSYAELVRKMKVKHEAEEFSPPPTTKK